MTFSSGTSLSILLSNQLVYDFNLCNFEIRKVFSFSFELIVYYNILLILIIQSIRKYRQSSLKFTYIKLVSIKPELSGECMRNYIN